MRRVPSWALIVAALAVFPMMPGVDSSTISAASLAAAYTLVGVSLVLLTGWVGQISLGHAAFVGIGAYATGWAAAGIGIPFPLSLPIAAAAGAAGAALLGIVALRVRGLFLAVATLIFSWMASEFLFRQEWATRHYLIPDRAIGGEGTLPAFDFSSRTTFFYVAWAFAVAGVFILVNVRDSKTGRAFFAVRGSEMATASLGIDVTRYKLLGFAISGALAGVAGNLLMTNSRAVTPDQFTFTTSLFFLAIAVVGGLRSLGGTIASALLFASLSEVFFRVPSLGGYLEFVSAAMLAVTLLVYPKGMAGLGALASGLWQRLSQLRGEPHQTTARPATRSRFKLPVSSERLQRWMPEQVRTLASGTVRRLSGLSNRRTRLKPQPLLAWGTPSEQSTNGSRHSEPHLPSLKTFAVSAQAANGNGTHHYEDPAAPEDEVPALHREDRAVLLEARNITVRFGGLVAVSDASLQVREGEITGLIGPNGAGKTTLFNTIAGFVTPTQGEIRLFGDDVTALPVHTRAQLGVARTFQAIQLFPQLTVFENLLVATHLQNESGVFAHMVVTADAIKYEQAARHRVQQVLELLDLQHIAERRAADLPFGVLRMVEMARSIVTGFRVMMLDEPASGLDNSETDRLIEVIRFVRGLGVTVLLIEHDIRMVTSVSDYLYVLDQGHIISEGTSAMIQQDPAVVAAYLGEPVTAEVGV